MRKVIAFIVFVLFCSNLFGQDTDNVIDKEEIKEVIHKFLSGVTNYDVNLLKQAFHPDAKLYYLDKQDNLKQMTQYEWYGHIKPPTRAMERKNEIISIDITGKAAMVKTRSVFKQFEFAHYLSLLKINNQWLIVNQTFYRTDYN